MVSGLANFGQSIFGQSIFFVLLWCGLVFCVVCFYLFVVCVLLCVSVLLCVVLLLCCCLWCVCVVGVFRASPPDPPPPDPSAGPPKISLFFFPLPPQFLFFSPSLVGPFRCNFGGVFEEPVTLKCARLGSRACETLAASGPPGLHTTTRELQTCTFERTSSSKKPPKFHEKDQKRGKKE